MAACQRLRVFPGEQRAWTYIEALGVHHDVVLVKVLRGEQIQFLLRLGSPMASMVRENQRRRLVVLVVHGEVQAVRPVPKLDLLRLPDRRIVHSRTAGGCQRLDGGNVQQLRCPCLYLSFGFGAADDDASTSSPVAAAASAAEQRRLLVQAPRR